MKINSTGINHNGVEDYIAPRAGAQRVWLALAALALVILFGWQMSYPFMEKYAQHRDYRTFLSIACQVFRCDLPPRQDTSRLAITNTRVDFHPFTPGGLIITVKLANNATFAQPYPHLQLTVTDRGGRVVGRRAYSPADYKSDAHAASLGSGELGVVQLTLARPHDKAVGFDVQMVAADPAH